MVGEEMMKDEMHLFFWIQCMIYRAIYLALPMGAPNNSKRGQAEHGMSEGDMESSWALNNQIDVETRCVTVGFQNI